MTLSLRVAAKATKTSAARLCAAAAEASQPHPVDTDVSAGSQYHPATSVAGSRGASPREDATQSYSLTTLVSRMTYSTQNHLHRSRARPGYISRLCFVRRGAVVRWVN